MLDWKAEVHMLQTYRAILQNGRVEWENESPADEQPVHVQVTVLDAPQPNPRGRGEKMAAALQRLADAGGLVGISDPIDWQRETRQDRPLPGREQ